MFKFSIPKNKQTITVWGTYQSLKCLYNIIHILNERERIFSNKEGMLMSLCYELRKAFENKRQTDEEMGSTDYYSPEIGGQNIHFYHIHGAEINPLLLLMCTAYLHRVRTDSNITKLEQGYVLLLEDVTENAIHAYTPKTKTPLMDIALDIALIAPYEYICEDLNDVAMQLSELTPSKRTKLLEPTLLDLLNSYKTTPC